VWSEGGALVTFPCELDTGHAGPCVARDNAPSVSARRRWEDAQALTEAAIAHGVSEREQAALEPDAGGLQAELMPTMLAPALTETVEALGAAAEAIRSFTGTVVNLCDELEVCLLEERIIDARATVGTLRMVVGRGPESP